MAAVAEAGGREAEDLEAKSPRHGTKGDATPSAGGRAKKQGIGTTQTELNILLERVDRVQSQNQSLMGGITELNKLIEEEQAVKDDLDMVFSAAGHDDQRNKATAQNQQRTVVHKRRTDWQSAADKAEESCELLEVHGKLKHVKAQLGYAIDVQERELLDCANKISARTRRARRMEDAFYFIVSEAQSRPELRAAVEAGIQRCGPAAQGVLKRSAERRALEWEKTAAALAVTEGGGAKDTAAAVASGGDVGSAGVAASSG